MTLSISTRTEYYYGLLVSRGSGYSDEQTKLSESRDQHSLPEIISRDELVIF